MQHYLQSYNVHTYISLNDILNFVYYIWAEILSNNVSVTISYKYILFVVSLFYIVINIYLLFYLKIEPVKSNCLKLKP